MARIIGEITVGGFKIGVIRLDDGPGVASPFPDPDLHEPMSRYGSGFRRQPQSAPGGHHHEHAPPHAGHHGRRQRFGGEGDTDPPPSTAPDSVHPESDRVYGELAAARDRARRELAEKPWLREKAIRIMAGENNNPLAATSLWESAINRAAVRGTNLESEIRRHQTEGGYYAGYNANPSAHERAVHEQALDRALGYSNVSGYATDNSSNQPGNHLADRDVNSGRFERRAVYNGEHFFRPLGQSQRWRRKWEQLQYQSETIRAMEAHKAEAEQLASGETAP
jgi:hypothetical protein